MAASIAQAYEVLLAARREEGGALLGVLTGQIDRIAELVGEAERHAQAQPLAIKERFERRMAELAGESVSEDRVLQEAAALAAKADVREELDRLAGHVAAARQLVSGDGAVGRRLDFLTQELNREANTLASKASGIAVTDGAVALKLLIEQMREQVQNLE